MTLYATDRGEGRTATVLLHGLGGWHGAWKSVTAGLSGRIIAYDLPGHGRSLHFPGAGPAKLAARAIAEDVRRRGLDRVHLVGHSMGGAVAALIALAEPGQVLSLTLLAPGGMGEEVNGALLRRYAAATTADELRVCLTEMAGPHSRIDRRFVDRLARIRSLPGQTAKLVDIAGAVAGNDRQGVIPRPSLAGLAMPVSVLWGTTDPVLPYAQAERLPPAFDIHPLPGAGHMLIEEAPKRVAETVRRLVD